MKPERYERQTEVPDGNEGVRHSMTRLAALIREGAQSSFVRAWAATMASPERGLDGTTVERLTTWVRGRMRYTPDPPEMERITSPAALLEEIGRLGHAVGDCDEYVSLLGGLLAALGFSVNLVLLSTDPDQMYRHVALTVWLPDGTRVPVDVSSEYAVGWEEPHWTAKEVIPV
jgi:transglutaminase-like putative cysteine protease